MKPSNQHGIVVIGGSAGSLDPLRTILSHVPLHFPMPFVVITHRMKNVKSLFSRLFRDITKLKVLEVEDKMPINNAYLYIAPTNYHLLIEEDYSFALDYSEPENFSRPSINPTFETAAEVYKKKTFAILLSGANDDGLDGLIRVKQKGGTIIVQDPATAEYPTMPQSAINANIVDIILSPEEIASYLKKLAIKQ